MAAAQQAANQHNHMINQKHIEEINRAAMFSRLQAARPQAGMVSLIIKQMKNPKN